MTDHCPLTTVLHVALNPVTGVWSLMRELALAQARSGLYAGVGVGIIADAHWPSLCHEELQSLGLPIYAARTPHLCGTGQFLWQRLRPPPFGEWLADLLTRSCADHAVVHFHNAWLSGVFLPLAPAPSARVRAVATFHGVNAHFRRQPIRRRLHQWMAARLARFRALLTSVDRANLARAQSLLHLDPSSFTVVPNGIADTPVRACPSLRGVGSFTLGHVGSLGAAKGWRFMVEAIRRLRARGVAVAGLLAGRGPDVAAARTLAQESGGWLSYEGFVPHPRERLLPRLDALVLMSEQEGLPMAIVEALSVGLPVIATPVGGIPEVVTPDRNGFLVPRTVEALVEPVAKLARDRALLRSFSAHARHDFEHRFEITQIVCRYDEVYRTADY